MTSSVDPQGAGRHHLQTMVDKIIEADANNLTSVGDVAMALGWGGALVKEAADQGDETAIVRLGLATLVLGGAGIGDLLREVAYYAEVLDTASGTSPQQSGNVPQPPPLFNATPPSAPSAAANPSTPAKTAAKPHRHGGRAARN